jgi:hypothetical protein
MKIGLAHSAAVALLFGCFAVHGVEAADETLVNKALSACPSDKTILGGVNACGKVWKLGSGQAEVRKDGTTRVDLKGLVLNDASTGQFNGSPDGVDAVAVALVCDGKVAAQSDPVPLSKEGNATVNAKLSVPSDCKTPMVLVRERYEGKIGGWLAASK